MLESVFAMPSDEVMTSGDVDGFDCYIHVTESDNRVACKSATKNYFTAASTIMRRSRRLFFSDDVRLYGGHVADSLDRHSHNGYFRSMRHCHLNRLLFSISGVGA